MAFAQVEPHVDKVLRPSLPQLLATLAGLLGLPPPQAASRALRSARAAEPPRASTEGCGAGGRCGLGCRCCGVTHRPRVWRDDEAVAGGLPAGGTMAQLTTATLTRWSDDEAVAYRLVSNEMHFFDGKAPTQQAVHKLRVENIAKCAVYHTYHGDAYYGCTYYGCTHYGYTYYRGHRQARSLGTATRCSGGCDPVRWRLQPDAVEAATRCGGGCNPMQ